MSVPDKQEAPALTREVDITIEQVIDAIASHSEVNKLMFWNVDRESFSYKLWRKDFIAEIEAMVLGVRPKVNLQRHTSRPEDDVQVVVADDEDFEIK